jgi:hypothetical protein
MPERYGSVFRTNDALVGELFHVADRELLEQIFRWEPAQVMEPVLGSSSILLLDG